MRVDAASVLARRRVVLSVLAPAIFGSSRILRPSPSHAASSIPFKLPIPDGFVSLPPPKDQSDTLFVAGNFRTGTTISVQRVDATALRKLLPINSPPCEDGAALLCQESAASLAIALAAYRDRQAAPSGCRSEPIAGTVRLGDGGKLTFEMQLALASGSPDPELSRHTAVSVIGLSALSGGAGGGDLICLWAGAKTSEWEAGDGPVLLRSVEAFALY